MIQGNASECAEDPPLQCQCLAADGACAGEGAGSVRGEVLGDAEGVPSTKQERCKGHCRSVSRAPAVLQHSSGRRLRAVPWAHVGLPARLLPRLAALLPPDPACPGQAGAGR